MIEEKLSSIDKTSVDKYPVFSDCESLNEDEEADKLCFVSTLSNHIANHLAQHKIVLENELETSFELVVEVDKEGRLNIKSYTIDETLREAIPNIENMVTQSLLSLPKIYPAYKRLPLVNKNEKGELIAVSTQFIIPIKVVARTSE